MNTGQLREEIAEIVYAFHAWATLPDKLLCSFSQSFCPFVSIPPHSIVFSLTIHRFTLHFEVKANNAKAFPSSIPHPSLPCSQDCAWHFVLYICWHDYVPLTCHRLTTFTGINTQPPFRLCKLNEWFYLCIFRRRDFVILSSFRWEKVDCLQVIPRWYPWWRWWNWWQEKFQWQLKSWNLHEEWVSFYKKS